MGLIKDMKGIRRRLVVILLCFALVYVVFEIVSTVQDRRATLMGAQGDAASVSAALSEHADRAIGEADSMLQKLIADYQRADKTVTGNEERLHHLLAAYNDKLPQTSSTNMLDARGNLLASGAKFPVSASQRDFSDRDYFQYHIKTGDAGLFISRPLLSRTSGKWMFTLSRAINYPDGSIKAVFVTGIVLGYFDGFYRSLNLGKATRMQLVRQDGWVLMRHPAVDGAPALNVAHGMLFEQFRREPAGSYLSPKSLIDGQARVIGYTGSNTYPILALISLSERDVLLPWRERAYQSLIEAVITLGMVAVLGALLWRYLNQIDFTQAHVERQSRSLTRSEKRYQQLVDGIDGIVWEASLPDLHFTYVSANAAGITGYPASDWLNDENFWSARLGGTPKHAADILSRLERNGALEIEHKLIASDGRTIWLRNNVTLTNDTDDQPRLRGVMVNDTERRQAYEERELASQVFETSMHAVMIFSTGGRILRVNRAFLAVTGFGEEEVIGRNATWFESHFLQPGFVDMVRTSLRQSGKWQGESPMRTKDGSEIIIMQSISVIRDADGRARSTVTIFHDITGEKQSEKQLYQLAHFDALTQLPNRQALAEKIRLAVDRAGQEQSGLALLLIDIDHFKNINDSLGHDIGDRMLRVVAGRIADCLGTHDTLARIGGDEFVILLERLTQGVEQIEQTVERVMRLASAPIEIDGKELYVSLSVGISAFPQDSADSDALLRNADTAMYRAKAAGRNGWRFFDESMARHAAHRLDIETALRRAVERNELLLHYQPQRSLGTGRVVGVEALLRWQRPGVGIVPPLEFIPLAEESGLILPIGNWVLHAACEQAARWMRERDVSLRIAVNISARQIHDAGFVSQVRDALEQSGLPPNLLELEITESSIVENLDETVNKLHRLKELGVTIAIDDFGTGYSSLSYLKQLPIDRLKIDRSFVKDTPGDSDDCAIVRTIIAMARNMGLSVIAEGVELKEQLDFLAAEGCSEIQGYLLSKPLPAEEIVAKL